MKDSIILIIKGFIIGIGKVIPGVSGAMLAITLNVYDKAIDVITHFFNDIKNNIKFLFFLGIGVVLAIIFFSAIITYFINNHYLITLLLFIGMIIGGIPSIIKQTKAKNYLIIFISFIIILLLSITSIYNNYVMKNNFIDNIVFFIGGLLDAIGTVVPGVSGTALLMILGVYNQVMQSLGNLLNISDILKTLIIIIPFTIGLLIGLIGVSLLMNILLKRYKNQTYSAIIGITIATIVLLFIKTFSVSFTALELIIGIILLIIGIIISSILDR